MEEFVKVKFSHAKLPYENPVLNLNKALTNIMNEFLNFALHSPIVELNFA